MRLPLCGPKFPVAKPSLLLVTQDYQLHLWYLRAFHNAFKSLRISLLQPGIAAENMETVEIGGRNCVLVQG